LCVHPDAIPHAQPGEALPVGVPRPLKEPVPAVRGGVVGGDGLLIDGGAALDEADLARPVADGPRVARGEAADMRRDDEVLESHGHGQFEDCYDVIAEFLGCRGKDIALVRNTTEGNSTVTFGLDLQAGDEVVIGTAEYRYHLPRILAVGEPGTLFGQDFAYRPSNELARPDWDLILKAFVDAASMNNNDQSGLENNEDLVGAGVGVELQLSRNLNLRLDWATALKSVEDDDAGDDRLHFVGTVLY